MVGDDGLAIRMWKLIAESIIERATTEYLALDPKAADIMAGILRRQRFHFLFVTSSIKRGVAANIAYIVLISCS